MMTFVSRNDEVMIETWTQNGIINMVMYHDEILILCTD